MTEPRPRPLWVHLVWVAIAAAIGHRLSLVFFDADSGISAAWPASGLWLALLLRSERQRWPWIIATIGLVSLIADMLLVKSLAVSLGYVGSNVLEMSLGAWVMTRVAGENIDFRRLRHVLALLLVVSLVNGLATLPGAWAGAQFGTAGFWAAARTWWTADALGLLVVTPALVAWSSPRATMPEKGLEACAFLVLWTVASVLTFTSTATFVYPYQLICLLAFPALRYGTGVVALALTLLGGIALVAAFQSPSFPFDGAQIFERVTQAQLFLLVSAATALILVASTEERRSAAAEIESGEQLLSLAMNAAGLGAWRYDVASNKVAWSSEVEKIFGLAPGTFDGRFETYISLLHPADRQRVVDTVA